MREAGCPSTRTIPCFPSAFFFFFFTIERKDLIDNHCTETQGTEDAHSVRWQGISSLTATHTCMPEHTLTRTNAPAWLLPPLRGEAGPEHQHCWIAGLVRETRNISMSKSRKSCNREMARESQRCQEPLSHSAFLIDLLPTCKSSILIWCTQGQL